MVNGSDGKSKFSLALFPTLIHRLPILTYSGMQRRNNSSKVEALRGHQIWLAREREPIMGVWGQSAKPPTTFCKLEGILNEKN
jgi:hypothetical protein